jgi:hypothetical protein
MDDGDVDDKNLGGSIVALDSGSSQFHILAGIEVHIQLDLAFQGVQLLLTLAHAADDHDGGDDD